MNSSIKRLLVVAATVLASATLSFAAPVTPVGTHGQTLPGANPFGGGGIPHDDVTVATYSGLTLGLSAHERFVGPISSNGNGVFFAATGESAPGLATWNFNFYIENTTGPLANYSYKLSYGNAADASTLLSINPSFIPDNEPFLSTTIAGNSENLGWFMPGFNPNADADYGFILQAFSSTDTAQSQALATAAIVVSVGRGNSVPDAGSTVALLGLALAGMVGLRRKMAA